MSVTHLPAAAIWPTLIQQLVSDPASLADFHAGLCAADTLVKRTQERTFSSDSRSVLVEALKAQHRGFETTPEVDASLDKLALDNATCITTGHQLCLASGPVYFLSKIASVVRLAQTTEGATGTPVVPVFWMASEDHDLPEVDHFHLGGQVLRWNARQTGAVGRMDLRGLSNQFEEWAADPTYERWSEGLKAMGRYYRQGTLADATRRLVLDVFGKYGVVVLDGDDPALKRLFLPVLRRELLDAPSEAAVLRQTAALKGQGYDGQVHPRPVNLFYLTTGGRHRVVKEGDAWQALDTPHSWNRERLLAELEAHPERFSPNVVLRPVYQEAILPNLAYVGGPGEISYWLQLKGVFAAFELPYPLLRVRHSTLIVPPHVLRKHGKLGMDWNDYFQDLHTLEATIAQRLDVPDTDQAKVQIKAIVDQLARDFAAFDPSLKASVEGESTKMEKGLDNLNKKALRAAKQRSDVALRQLHDVHQFLFPSGVFQERVTNVLELQPFSAESLAQVLVEALDPHSTDLHLIFAQP